MTTSSAQTSAPKEPSRPDNWIEVRRGFGSLEMSELASNQFVTASGLFDGGYIIWTLRKEKP